MMLPTTHVSLRNTPPALLKQEYTGGLVFWLQGGIDNYENAMEAAVRELQEETGITSARIVSTVRLLPSAGRKRGSWVPDSDHWSPLPGQMDKWLAYDFPTLVRNSMTGSITRFKGQTQKW